MNGDFEWNEVACEFLRSLWAQGISTAAIGQRLGATKNSVVGKANRLGLPPRPCPIKRDPSKPRTPARLAVVKSAVAAALVVAPMPVRVGPAVMVGTRKSQSCCWPIGEPGSTGFHFCNDDGISGKPYCSAHCDIAYERPGKMRAETMDRLVRRV